MTLAQWAIAFNWWTGLGYVVAIPLALLWAGGFYWTASLRPSSDAFLTMGVFAAFIFACGMHHFHLAEMIERGLAAVDRRMVRHDAAMWLATWVAASALWVRIGRSTLSAWREAT